MFVNHVERCLAAEGRSARQHHVHHRSERIQVALLCGALSFCLFGRHVLDRANDATGDGQLLRREDLRHAEVS